MGYEKYTEEYTEPYEFGGLNDNKKITATFSHYEVTNINGEMYIGAILIEGEAPKLQEGYGINGQQLWVSLQNLYMDIADKDDEAAAEIIISWCMENVHPYYFFGDPYAAFDISQEKDTDYWDTMVNVIGLYDFSINQMREDLKKLFDRTNILLMLYRSIHMVLTKDERQELEQIEGFKKFSTASPIARCHMIKEYIDKEIPKLPLGLTLDVVGEFRIVPDFTSVFDVAYYALAQYVTASPDYPLHWGARTGIGYCESCGNIFIKNGNRQKYCDNPECKKERNRRKAQSAYYRKIQKKADEQWT